MTLSHAIAVTAGLQPSFDMAFTKSSLLLILLFRGMTYNIKSGCTIVES